MPKAATSHTPSRPGQVAGFRVCCAARTREGSAAAACFEERGGQVWLTDDGRQKAIELFERRKRDEWKHSVVGYSLSYARMVELEARLLEKEWSGEGQLFARFRLR